MTSASPKLMAIRTTSMKRSGTNPLLILFFIFYASFTQLYVTLPLMTVAFKV